MRRLAVLVILALAGCGSAGQGVDTTARAANAAGQPPTAAQAACAVAVRAFEGMASPLDRRNPAGTFAAAQQWSAILAAVTGTPGVSSTVLDAIAREAASIGVAGADAQEAEYAGSWDLVVPGEQQLDASFQAVESACLGAGAHVS